MHAALSQQVMTFVRLAAAGDSCDPYLHHPLGVVVVWAGLFEQPTEGERIPAKNGLS